jgi:hypothetical protein
VFIVFISFMFFEYWHFLLALISLPLGVTSYVWYHNRRHSLDAVLRASYRLVWTRLKWKRACDAAEISDGPKRPRLLSLRRHPKIANSAGTAIEFTINLQRIGLTVKHLEDNKDYFAATLNARRTRVIRLTPGVARFTVEWEKNHRKSAVIGSSKNNDTQLPMVELDQDVMLALDTSILVVGESGAGKSNLTWVILNELNKLTAQDLLSYRLYVIDPKKVELAELIDSPHTIVYSDTPSSADEVIERFHSDMMATFERMKAAGIRKAPLLSMGEHQITYPLNILIIDELLLTEQARKGINTHLGEILSAGRAAGYIVIGDSQLGQVDALSRLRDLFPQRICMAVKSAELTAAVLGPRAEERGAKCTEITEDGVGYIYTDFTGSFQRFLPPYIDDVEIVARGSIWYPKWNPFSGRPKPKGEKKQRVNPWGKPPDTHNSNESKGNQKEKDPAGWRR